ncbi:acid phosphatase/Vanadium-dependent haloperoxidase [Terfezia boudieri ATCC MYA-4762]|uniref:Acid phosphatase/Vanadium-dependent haloperoxidase n=1 Tax=Terfezia boudieri ATCC MYA-4762 TaxID=1051890 RepID=A0A3N4M180_9PEZI|nr:acid phosphatase/Vanadium-dependent haloperoxidase [Terfezia boudieri ATCC MYA-4762]
MPSGMALSGYLRMPSRVKASYIFDYIIIVVLVIAFSALDKAEPFHQRFSVHNPSLQYPYADPERIAPWLAAVISVAFPAAVIILWTMVLDGLFSHHKLEARHRGYPRRGIYTMQERLWEMNAGILGLGLSVAALITIIGALKNLTGKPRPDVIARCKPRSFNEPPVGLTGWEDCTGDPIVIRDGFKSWPSGHSVAFGGLAYLSFYLAGKLHISDNRGEVWKTVIVLIPLLVAAIVAISRIMDARHHSFDVLSSSILGIFVAWVAYRQYFPSLIEPWKKGRAYPIRSWGKDSSQIAEVSNARTPHDEEVGKAGYIDTGLASSVPEDGAIIDHGQRRRQYLEDQKALERKRRRTHDFYDTYTGANQSQSTTPSGPAHLSPQPTAYQPTSAHDPDDVDAYEMSKPNQPYSSTIGRGTQSTTDSHESDDHRWGIAAATSAVGGQTLTFTPIQEEFAVSKKSLYGAQRVRDDEDLSR